MVGVLMVSGVLAAEAISCREDSECDDEDSCTLDICIDGSCSNDFSDNVVPDTDVIFATKDIRIIINYF